MIWLCAAHVSCVCGVRVRVRPAAMCVAWPGSGGVPPAGPGPPKVTNCSQDGRSLTTVTRADGSIMEVIPVWQPADGLPSEGVWEIDETESREIQLSETIDDGNNSHYRGQQKSSFQLLAAEAAMPQPVPAATQLLSKRPRLEDAVPAGPTSGIAIAIEAGHPLGPGSAAAAAGATTTAVPAHPDREGQDNVDDDASESTDEGELWGVSFFAQHSTGKVEAKPRRQQQKAKAKGKPKAGSSNRSGGAAGKNKGGPSPVLMAAAAAVAEVTSQLHQAQASVPDPWTTELVQLGRSSKVRRSDAESVNLS